MKLKEKFICCIKLLLQKLITTWDEQDLLPLTIRVVIQKIPDLDH